MSEALHRIRMIDVAPGVSLEVLDFGGAGDPIVLLAGLGASAHIFDDFAPQLTARHHVIAITRRGFGASSAPPDGYDTATRARDVIAVLDALAFPRAILIGHSIAGGELTAIAGSYPDRVIALVYLDAAYDHAARRSQLPSSWPSPPPTAAERASPQAYRNLFRRKTGVAFPIHEVMNLAEFDADGRFVRDREPYAIEDKVWAGTEHPDYTRVRCPALVLYQPAARDGLARDSQEQLRRHLQDARVVVYDAAAGHYPFIAIRDEVVEQIQRFVAALRSTAR